MRTNMKYLLCAVVAAIAACGDRTTDPNTLGDTSTSKHQECMPSEENICGGNGGGGGGGTPPPAPPSGFRTGGWFYDRGPQTTDTLTVALGLGIPVSDTNLLVATLSGVSQAVLDSLDLLDNVMDGEVPLCPAVLPRGLTYATLYDPTQPATSPISSVFYIPAGLPHVGSPSPGQRFNRSAVAYGWYEHQSEILSQDMNWVLPPGVVKVRCDLIIRVNLEVVEFRLKSLIAIGHSPPPLQTNINGPGYGPYQPCGTSIDWDVCDGGSGGSPGGGSGGGGQIGVPTAVYTFTIPGGGGGGEDDQECTLYVIPMIGAFSPMWVECE